MSGHHKYWIYLSVFLGVALQVQLTLPSHDGYIGLRLNLADLTLPIVGIIILISLFQKKSIWPGWLSNLTLPLLGLLSAVVCFGILNGYFFTGFWNMWALLNKGVGWAVLVSYSLLAAWITTNCPPEALKAFLKSFIYTFSVLALGNMFCLLIEHYTCTQDIFPMNYPTQGLMANRNVFALLFLCIFGFIMIVRGSDAIRFHPLFISAFLLLIPLFILYNGSRILWIAFPVIFISVLLLNPKNLFKGVFLPLIAGVCLVALLLSLGRPCNIRYIRPANNLLQAFEYVHNSNHSKPQQTAPAITAKDNPPAASTQPLNDLSYKGDAVRLINIKHSLNLWKQSPFIGVGIGTSHKKQIEDFGKILSVVDCTPLWVLTEMGVMGLLVFTGFFLFCFITLLRSVQTRHDIYDKLAKGTLLCMAAFAIMCLLHELTYTRFIWFLLGLALAMPAKRHLQTQEMKSAPA